MIFIEHEKQLATDWPVRGSNSGDSEIFRTRPEQLWGSPTFLYIVHRVSFLGVKRSGREVDHLPPSSAEVKERVEIYLYCPSRPSWPILGWTLPLPSIYSTTSSATSPVYHTRSALHSPWSSVHPVVLKIMCQMSNLSQVGKQVLCC
jgi:hypothetical protein